MKLFVLGTLFGLLLAALPAAVPWAWKLARDARQGPSCLDVGRRAEIGVWSQIIGPDWTPPRWATDVEVFQCRDGRVATWRGEVPPFTSSGF